jgi:hypothetical protein
VSLVKRTAAKVEQATSEAGQESRPARQAMKPMTAQQTSIDKIMTGTPNLGGYLTAGAPW